MKRIQGKYLLLVALLSVTWLSVAQKSLHKISKDQKLYELSVIWKELSYNFANMDNCPGLNIDSLYRAYIPILQDSKNDFEYFKSMQKFVATFHNGHTWCDISDSLIGQLAHPLLITSYSNGKVLIDNIGSHYSKNVAIGDEILSIDNIPAMEYINKFSTPYVSTSNADDTRMKYSMFNPKLSTLISFAPKVYNKKIKLEIKTSHGIENINVLYDVDVRPSHRDSIRQSKLTYLNKISQPKQEENLLLTDSVNNFAYLRFTECNNEFAVFFQKSYDTIKKYNNLIIDLSDNPGGDGNAVLRAVCSLVPSDSLQWNKYRTRVNNANYRAKASSRIYYYQASNVSQQDKDLFYPYFYNTAFEGVPYAKFANFVPLSERYQGNIYVITSSTTASASEFFVTVLTKNPKTIILGKKTAGANAQPLVVSLPSGLEVKINTCKAYDYRGKDISSGITPDYERDFSDIYKIGKPVDWFRKLEEYVNELPQTKK